MGRDARGGRVGALALACCLILLVGCGSESDDQGSSGTAAPATAPKSDASAELACTHYRNVMADVDAGILTDVELRSKLKEVHDDAKWSEADGVADSATALLRAFTQMDTDALPEARRAMTLACLRAGH